MHYLDESHILLFLVQFFLLLLLARGLGEVFRRWKQPPLTGELLVGVLLGPTLLGRFFPEFHQLIFPNDLIQQNMLETVAWIGVLFLLLDAGLEIDFSIAWRRRGAAMTIAVSDIVVPMAIAFIPCLFLPERYLVPGETRWIFALFMATVLTISAMPIAARVLRDFGLLKSEMGFLIMSALAVNDIIGWAIFTIVLGLYTQVALNLGGILLILGGTVGFTAIAVAAGRPLATRVVDGIIRRKLPEPSSSLTFVCLLGLLFGAITQKIGIHALFGFFIAGIVVGEARSLSEETRRIISQMVNAIFVPVFFANIGLKLDFWAGFDFFLVTFVCALGVGGRYLGAFLGSRMAGVPVAERAAVAVAHTPGGMMEIVVALLALENGLITQQVFVAIVIGAVFSSILMGPWMRSVLKSRERVKVMPQLPEANVGEELSATTKEEAIAELWAVAVENGQGRLAAACPPELLTREQEFGTGLGGGVAAPHLRVPLAGDPIVVFGRSAAGLDWNAPDGEPAHLIFLMITPEDKPSFQLQALASIARVMGKETVRASLMEAADRASLHATLQKAFDESAGAL